MLSSALSVYSTVSCCLIYSCVIIDDMSCIELFLFLCTYFDFKNVLSTELHCFDTLHMYSFCKKKTCTDL